jgi:hypothetical protein
MKRSIPAAVTFATLALGGACARPAGQAAGDPSLAGDPVGSVRAHGIPEAVFRTRPTDRDGTIAGPGPLSVEFNLCQSRPASEDDDLKYTYDFDGDGVVDYFGHCRASHTYAIASARRCLPARVCVGDRRPGGEVCREYEVCVDGEGGAPATRTLSFHAPGPISNPPLPYALSSPVFVSGVRTIRKVTASVHLVHPDLHSVNVTLIGPAGVQQQVTLFSGFSPGIGGANLGTDCQNRTAFDDDAPTPYFNGIAPFLGTYRPVTVTPLSRFVGLSGASANGTWQLAIIDYHLPPPPHTVQCWTLSITSED